MYTNNMKVQLKSISVLTSLLLLFLLFGSNIPNVHAAPPAPPPPPAIQFKSGPPLEGCGIQTAIGCIPVLNQNQLAGFFLKWGMGLGGGVSLILMVFSTYNIMTSGGDPRKLQAAKEMLISAITGLIMLVFAAFILKFIGIDVLGIL